MTSAITTKNLEVRFGDAVALSSVNLDIPKGSSLAVIGPNGSGKSTLLGTLAGTFSGAASGVCAVVSAPGVATDPLAASDPPEPSSGSMSAYRAPTALATKTSPATTVQSRRGR